MSSFCYYPEHLKNVREDTLILNTDAIKACGNGHRGFPDTD